MPLIRVRDRGSIKDCTIRPASACVLVENQPRECASGESTTGERPGNQSHGEPSATGEAGRPAGQKAASLLAERATASPRPEDTGRASATR
jgi:hypothetical protein